MEVKNKESESLNHKYKIWFPLLFSLAAIIGLIGGYKMAGKDSLKSMVIEMDDFKTGQLGRVEELLRFVESRYVKDVNSDQLLTDAFENILSHLDPHSVYIKPEDMRLINDQMGGSFEGIGIESILLNDTLRVNHVIIDGPAAKSGLKIGDQIVAINDSIIAGRQFEFKKMREMLKGEKHSIFKLQIKEFATKAIKDVNIEIDDVDVKSAEGFLFDDDIAIISLSRFSSDSYIEFMKCLEKIHEEGGFKNLILDLRGNPGGFLPEATNILNQIFTEKGKLLVYTKGRGDRVSEFKTTGKNFYNIEKVAILVDEGSASGSEIIAGAIQDWDRGIIIGRRTFGKGLVQEQYDLSNGGALRLTVAEYFTPSGRLIQKSYADLDVYEGDIASRISSGELSGNSPFPIPDSTQFKTKIEKRTVYAGGGISPDIYIPMDSFQLSKENAIAQNQVAEFIFKKYIKGEFSIQLDAKTFVSEWNCPEELLADFKEFLGFNGENYAWLDNYLTIHLKAEIGKLYFGNKTELEVKLRADEYISQSIAAFSKKNIFAELKH